MDEKIKLLKERLPALFLENTEMYSILSKGIARPLRTRMPQILQCLACWDRADESPDQDKRVEQHQRRFAESGRSDFYVDDEVELLRGAFRHLNRVDFGVKIPFIDHIKFTDVRNRRNLPIFLDVIKAYCVLNYSARETDEEGALVATRQDYDNALGLFKTVAVQQVTKLNEREREVADVIKKNSPCDVPTIMDETGLSRSRVSELLHGDKDSGNKGMLEKNTAAKIPLTP